MKHPAPPRLLPARWPTWAPRAAQLALAARAGPAVLAVLLACGGVPGLAQTTQAQAQARPQAAAAPPTPPASEARGPAGMRVPYRPRKPIPLDGSTAPAAEPLAGKAIELGPGDPLDRLRERLARRLGPDGDGKASPRGTPAGRQLPGEFVVRAPAARLGSASGRAAGAAGADGAAKRSAAATGNPAEGPAWAYTGPLGPESWAALRPSFALCGTGQRQSPVDIRDGLPVDLEAVDFLYRPGFFSVTDNGYTVQVQVGAGNAIEVGARRYELTGFHFHLPGEERVDGRSFAMSIHLVHRDTQGRLAVVALVVEEGPEHPAVQAVWNHLPLERGEFVAASIEFDPATLLPPRRGYYTYMGSLTTPPCTEGVLWIVMQQPIQVSPQQLAIFARLHPMNARPVQPLNGRVIKQSR